MAKLATPKLRFPGFSDEWESRKLGDVAELTSSKRVYLSDYVQQGIPFYRGKEISEIKKNIIPNDILYISEQSYTNFKTRFGAPIKNEILITAVGTLGNILRVKNEDPFYFKDGNLIWLKGINENPFFTEIILENNKDKLLRSAIGSSQKALTIAGLKKISLCFPGINEQQRIADFLTATDEKILSIAKKVELLKKYKKGVMQKIFTREVRFKDGSGNDYPDWENKVLRDIFDYEQPTKYIVKSTEYKDSYSLPVLTAGKTFVLGYTDETEGVYKSLPVIIFDDFTTASHYVDFKFKVKSSAMKILKPKRHINARVAYELLSRMDYVSNEHKRHWIGEFQNFSIELPGHQEQQIIAEFLTTLDDKIKTEESKLTAAKKFKSALLQRMFV